ncbi:50S ribosomal protein L25/general stress protein Ctc [Compostimonas suwonensis]|uniref:Large ribosomal subunit protein bL25 n=1 Tax=Compostimonas suwonensis TaxID=1048394 RepID=A0A2M9BW44_9MICO|nr:50S ribosomal protein L25/general stress protein Ctc [Compostimonas suwonensis]PJJ62155.1 large subunit ribosomal protein L25 [Compostimonas suwonensis]
MADDDMTIAAEVRSTFGKGAARKLRAAGKTPAVIYGHGTDPQHVALPAHELQLLLRKANAVLDLDIEGTSQLALVKDVQKDPVRQIIEHIDLIVIRKGEKVQVEVAIHVAGEPVAGTVAELDAKTLLLEVEATNIPESVTVDVEGLEAGTHVLAKDVPLPKGATLITDEETLVIAVSVPSEQDLGDSESSETEAEPAAEAAAE